MSTISHDGTTAARIAAAEEFLRLLYGDEPPGFLNLFKRPGNTSQWLKACEPELIARQAVLHSAERNVYFSLGLHARPPQSGRGNAADIIAIGGLWGEIDILGPAHKEGELPPTLDAARELLEAIAEPPTLIIHSGHGIYPLWVFRELWRFEDDTEQREAHRLSRRLQRQIRQRAQERGWKIDGTADLSRVLRLPGTINHKLDPVEVRILECHPTRRYSPADFDWLPDVEDEVYAAPAGDFRPAQLAPILEGCGWLRHCRDQAAALSEPDWYGALSIVGRCEDGRNAAHEISRPYPGYDPAETDEKLAHALAAAGPRTCANIRAELSGESFCQQCLHGGKIKSPIVLGMSRQNGRAAPLEQPAADEAQATAAEYQLTEEGTAERLIARHGALIRHCFGLKQWHLWDGKCWPPDETNQVEHYVVETAREMLREAADLDDPEAREALIRKSKAAESNRGMRAVLELARKHVPILPQQLDVDPYLLTVANGTIDLRTGERGDHRPDDFITACLDLNYQPAAPCPLFHRFLERVQPDPEVRQYLKEAMGYSLTGDIAEQVFFFLYGCGRKPDGMPGDGHNGKTTFVELFTRLLSRYAWKTDVNVFRNAEHEAERARPQLAQLRGRRLVVCSEMPDDFEINEALIKDVTGTDTIPARDVYRSAINFMPTFKVWMYGNYKPVITGTNEGIRRRPKLIEFPTYILPAERDKHLRDKLWEEREGIFAWAVEGAIERHQRGALLEPKAVTDATREYLEEMDPIGQFLKQRCEFGVSEEIVTTKDELYRAYQSWCWNERAEAAESDKLFGKRLRAMGIKSFRSANVMKFRGVRLRSDLSSH